MRDRASFWIKADHARQLTGGVIADVVSPAQAIVAADAGAAAVAVGCFGLQRGNDAITDGATVASVRDTVSIPVIARARDRAQAKELEALEVDYLLERCTDDTVLDKWSFAIPFVCEATSLGDVAGRLDEGAAMICCTGPTLAITAERLRRMSPRGKLSVLLACAGIVTQAEAVVVTRAGAEAVFLGPAIFDDDDPSSRARAIANVVAERAGLLLNHSR